MSVVAVLHPCRLILSGLLYVLAYLPISYFNRCVMLSPLVLICISLVTDDVEDVFMCLFYIQVSSLIKLFKSFEHLKKVGSFVSFLRLNMSTTCIPDGNRVLDRWFASIVS